nr:zinc finger protein 677-like [Aedes albopictus]
MASESIEIKKEITQNIQQVCRLCLENNQLHDIFFKKDIQRWIYNYLSITVSETDTLSKLICTDCRTRLEDFHGFKQRCLNAQEVLEGKSSTEIQHTKLKCEFCGKVFPVKSKLSNHMKIHMTRKYKCSICGKGFQQPSALARHTMRLHPKIIVHNEPAKLNATRSADKPQPVLTQCEVVLKQEPVSYEPDVGRTPTNVDQNETADLQLECDLCDKKFKLKKNLQDHRRNVHGPKRHKCPVCGKLFASKERLGRHTHVHAGFTPNETVAIFLEPGEAETDANSDTENKTTAKRKEPCSVCNRLIRDIFMEGHLNRHKGIHPYKCEMGCSEQFHCKVLRKSHYHDIHGWRSFECNICHQFFQNGRSCRMHKIKSHGQGHKCTECESIFETGAGLKRHLAKAHHSEGNADQREAMDEESQMDEEQPIKTDDLFEAGDIKVECQSDEDEEMS